MAIVEAKSSEFDGPERKYERIGRSNYYVLANEAYDLREDVEGAKITVAFSAKREPEELMSLNDTLRLTKITDPKKLKDLTSKLL